MDGAARWGVTVLQAEAEMDAGTSGPPWFAMPGVAKSATYRTELSDAAAEAVLLAVAGSPAAGTGLSRWIMAERTSPAASSTVSPARPEDRLAHRIHRTVLAKLRAADSSPGVLDQIGDTEFYLFGGHPEDELRGGPGTILARRNGAICRATADGAVWIPQLRRRPGPGGPKTFKLPATLALRSSPDGPLDGVPVFPAR